MPMDDGRKLFVVRAPRAARKAKQETIAPSPPSQESEQRKSPISFVPMRIKNTWAFPFSDSHAKALGQGANLDSASREASFLNLCL